MLGNRNEIARLQSDFYRDQFRKVVRWLLVSVTLLFMLIALIVYFILTQPKPQYYGNTITGRVLKMPLTV